METAEPIAQVVADIRAGRVVHPAAVDLPGRMVSATLLERAQLPQPVVDCTAIFQMQLAAEAIDLYDDHPEVVPPWGDALLCYVNTFGNVCVLQVHREDHDGGQPKGWNTGNVVDWSRVRWVAETALWTGGVSGEGRVAKTAGPVHLFRHAIYESGAPADIQWVSLVLTDPGQTGELEPCAVALGASLNFLNASNTDVAEPARPRPLRRRLARAGVMVQNIVVRPPGRRRSATVGARPIGADETVLNPVRGHFSHYGPAYEAGLLFGKYAGKFWVPSHARGKGNEADPVRDYTLRPGR